MKVIIELNQFMSIENHPECSDEILVCIDRNLERSRSVSVSIEELKTALRKMTAK